MIRFSKYLWLYFLLSALVLVPGIISLVAFGLRPSIDFTGGTLLELRFTKTVTKEQVTGVVNSDKLPLVSMQNSGNSTYLLRLKPVGDDKINLLQKHFSQELNISSELIRNEAVGPILGRELLIKAITAAAIAIIAILFYVAYAFRNFKFGISAVLALFHDLLVVLGIFSLFGHYLSVEVDTLFVTAFLTTMSFSVHDTIVVFDRIREFMKRGERGAFTDLCDRALTETMGRSLANSLTIVFMLLALVLMGGANVHWFAVALLIGTISGTYSSPFVATPILILWDKWEKRRFQGK